MTNAQKISALVTMAVILGLLIFVKNMWEAGNLTLAIVGLIAAVVLLAVVIAIWQNSAAVLGFFNALPGRTSSFLGQHWATMIAILLIGGMVWVGGGMLWKGAKTAVGFESTLTRPIPTPGTTSTSASASGGVAVATVADTIRRTVLATNGWSPEEVFPTGYNISITPRDGVAYAVMAADGQVTEVPAVAPTPGYRASFKGPLHKVRIRTTDSGTTGTFDIVASR